MNNLNIKKAAMFGLDARIALAVFGALSVISGAALYSAIQNAKNTSLLANIKEFAKAYEQIVLDTGSDLPVFNGVERKVEYLIEKSDFSGSGWNGPYINYIDSDSVSTDGRIAYDGVIKWIVRPYQGTVWSTPSATVDNCKLAGSPCFNWILREGDLTKQKVDFIEKQIDGVVNYSEGNVRVKVWAGPPEDYTLYIKIMPTLNSPLN
jgi:type II secretory pathway pseudopilin PulG